MITLSFPDPARRLTLNDRDHWRTRARITKAWRTTAAAHGVYRMVALGSPLGPTNVAVSFGVRDPNRRRDGHNWIPTVKAIVDGLTDVGVFEDDDTTHVTVIDPTFHKGEGVTITLTPRGATDGN